MNDLHSRNIRALADAANEARRKAEALEVRVGNLERALLSANDGLATLRGQIAVLLASRGGGPTAR